MLKNLSAPRPIIALAILVAFMLPSCITQKVVYLTDVPKDSSARTSVMPAEFKEPVIQIDDILNISIQTIDPQTSAALNQSGASMTGTNSTATGFLVDKNGEVEIPMLGVIKLVGLTTSEAKNKVRSEASKFYKSPTVQVRFANYKITVIGEVNKPATYTIPSEKFSILDAIGMAGDLTIYGKRDNIMLIRDNEGKKEIVRLDLTSTSIMKSPFFYLKQNDVIYIEPGKARVAQNNTAAIRYTTVALSVTSLLISIILRFR